MSARRPARSASHKREVGEVPPRDRLEDLDGHVKLTGRAGSALVWNGHLLHTSTDNTHTNARRMLLFNYTHFGMKQYECCVATGKEKLPTRHHLHDYISPRQITATTDFTDSCA